MLSAQFENIGGLKPARRSRWRASRSAASRASASTWMRCKAVVTLRIDGRYNRIPEDSDASIFTAGLLGGQYIGITPGGAEEFFKDGDRIEFVAGRDRAREPDQQVPLQPGRQGEQAAEPSAAGVNTDAYACILSMLVVAGLVPVMPAHSADPAPAAAPADATGPQELMRKRRPGAARRARRRTARRCATIPPRCAKARRPAPAAALRHRLRRRSSCSASTGGTATRGAAQAFRRRVLPVAAAQLRRGACSSSPRIA